MYHALSDSTSVRARPCLSRLSLLHKLGGLTVQRLCMSLSKKFPAALRLRAWYANTAQLHC